jgi:cellulose synthase/poly-beta-1,6-N-acetylglucosamine synthase-like glycosyltransferase
MILIAGIFWFLLFLVVYSYFIYPILIGVWAVIHPAKRARNESYQPSVAMVLAAYNEESVIAEKIENFTALDYPQDKISLYIGSDGSSDKTNEILSACHIKNVHAMLYQERSGKAGVLNRLIQNVTADILVFSDANTIYEPGAIKKLVRHFADDKVGGVCGLLVLTSPNDNSGGKGERTYWAYENFIKRMEGAIKTVLGANGAIYALRRFLFHPLPESKMISDDFYIPLKAVEAGYDVVYDNTAKAHEKTSPTLEGEFTRKVRIGASNFNGLKEIKSLLHPGRGFVALALWSHKVIRWFVPFILLGLFFMNANLTRYAPYNFFFLVQLLFYSFAFVGHLLEKNGKSCPAVFRYPLYFVAMNAAIFVGFIKFVRGTQKAAWTRVERI